jgi:hypothetical protein
MKTSISNALCAGLLFIFAAGCGQSSGTGEVFRDDTRYPYDQAILAAGTTPDFFFQAGSDTHYQIIISVDTGTSTEFVEQSNILGVGGDGMVRWKPTKKLKQNMIYEWQSKPIDAARRSVDRVGSSNVTMFYVMAEWSQPRSPRADGWFDINHIDESKLAVGNSFYREGIEVTFDIELFAADGVTMIDSVKKLPQDSASTFTAWIPAQPFAEGNYQWRYRTWIDKADSDWYGPFMFTVANLCDIPGSKYAEYVIDAQHHTQCDEILRTDTSEILGYPSVGGFITQDDPGWGFYSMGHDSDVSFEMGKTIVDRPGVDIGVYEYYSTEPLEVFAAQSAIGPWYSIGFTWCHIRCDFDLGYAGLAYARYFKIYAGQGRCYQTAGPDIYGIVAFHSASNYSQCQ